LGWYQHVDLVEVRRTGAMPCLCAALEKIWGGERKRMTGGPSLTEF